MYGVIPAPPSDLEIQDDPDKLTLWERDMSEAYGDPEIVRWGIQRVREYQYRKMFNLSKREMLEEPMEDFNINLTIEDLVNKASERKSRDIVKTPHKQ